ncbi:TPA: hypothetical protein NJ015_004675 [Vibrio parahaemolyticus]|nr:hypothetical protein [Vibrio parahaemolyticus]
MEISDIELNKAYRIKLVESAYDEFCDASDFIWKTPRFIDTEREEELAKLPVYFPSSPDLAAKRWLIESKKIEGSFPFFMSRGNLFSIASLYESYLLLLVKEIEVKTGTKFSDARGQGMTKINNYFRMVKLDYKSIDLYKQVDAAITIRNTLFHANGVLDWCKKPNQVRSIVHNKSFLSSQHRVNDPKSECVIISKTNLGERLEIVNYYSYLASIYFRDYFVRLCLESKEKEKI